jgi:transcriptional regulator with XRE-family HTH domain
MSQLLEGLRETFQDETSRYAYVESYLNASIASQIKKLRGQMSQQELAEKIGTKQSGISRLENANYSAWKVETLRKLARAFGLRLRISFEEFGTLVPEIENFKKGTLTRRRFENDPAFKEALTEERESVAIAGLAGLAGHRAIDAPLMARQWIESANSAYADYIARLSERIGGGSSLAGAKAIRPESMSAATALTVQPLSGDMSTTGGDQYKGLRLVPSAKRMDAINPLEKAA